MVVIQHDETIKAMTGADLAIKDTPYAELKKYVYRPRGGFTNETIVTLPEALAIAKAMPGIWIDFKYFKPAFAEKVLNIVAEAGISRDRVMVATFNQAALEYMRDNHPDIRRVGHIQIVHQSDEDDYTPSFADNESRRDRGGGRQADSRLPRPDEALWRQRAVPIGRPAEIPHLEGSRARS